METLNTPQALQLVYEKIGAENIASISHVMMELLLEACLRTVMTPLYTFLLSTIDPVEDEESRRNRKECASVATVEEEETFKVGSRAVETFGNQTVRVRNALGLLSASQVKGDYVCKFLRQLQEHDFGTSKAGDGIDTDVKLKQKDIAEWLMMAKKGDDDEDDDDDEEEDEDDDVDGEEGGYEEGEDEDDDNEDDDDAADDEDDDEGEDEDGGDGEDDEDDDEEDDDEDDEEDEEEEPPKKKTK